ncbi:MAG: hypothetical protein RLZZ300_2462, partial [Pseudomonadota bacterium]
MAGREAAQEVIAVDQGVGRVRHWLQVPVTYEEQGIINPACNGKEILVDMARLGPAEDSLLAVTTGFALVLVTLTASVYGAGEPL